MKKLIPIFILSSLIFVGPIAVLATHVPGHGIPGIGGDGGTPVPAVSGDPTNPIPAVSGDAVESGIPNPLKAGNLILFIKQVVDQVLKFTEILAALLIIWSGFLFVKAQGDPAELETARRNFFYVIIGTAILLAAHVITDIIINTINQLR